MCHAADVCCVQIGYWKNSDRKDAPTFGLQWVKDTKDKCNLNFRTYHVNDQGFWAKRTDDLLGLTIGRLLSPLPQDFSAALHVDYLKTTAINLGKTHTTNPNATDVQVRCMNVCEGELWGTRIKDYNAAASIERVCGTDLSLYEGGDLLA